jgi:hypothetical protein
MHITALTTRNDGTPNVSGAELKKFNIERALPSNFRTFF